MFNEIRNGSTEASLSQVKCPRAKKTIRCREGHRIANWTGSGIFKKRQSQCDDKSPSHLE